MIVEQYLVRYIKKQVQNNIVAYLKNVKNNLHWLGKRYGKSCQKLKKRGEYSP